MKMGCGPSCGGKRKFSLLPFDIREPKPVSLDDFQVLRSIGKGSFGKVCIVQKRDNMKMFAMKYVNKRRCVEKDAFKNFLREIKVLSGLEHPFLVNLWFSFQDEEDMFIVVDLLPGGDLRYHLQQNRYFQEDQVVLYICEIALALDYLGSKGILHRDIKPDNILMDNAGHTHISDFNIALVLKDGELVRSVGGTKPYMAPEVLDGQGYSFEVDWWSLGITAYEAACGMRPYGTTTTQTSMQELHKLMYNSCLRFPKRVDSGLASLIQQLLALEPENRISSLEEMQNHYYLRSVDFSLVYNRLITPSFVPKVDQLNYDPAFELEEMIMESMPLHKKKKRLSKRRKHKSARINEDDELIQMQLKKMQKEFIVYNRERDTCDRELGQKNIESLV